MDSYGNSGITRQNINRFLIFSRTAILFFQRLPLCYILRSNAHFLHILASACYFHFLDIGYLKGCEVELHCGETGTIISIFF